MIPAYRIEVDGADVTARFQGQSVTITLTDKQGTESDELELSVSDPDASIALPRRGVLVRVAIGWAGQALVDKGSYQIDEVEHSGPPDIIKVKGRAAQLQGKIKEQREDSYHDVTLGEIVSTIADRQGLIAAIDPTLAKINIPHIDQTTESDANFLTRISKDYGATATVKDGRLVFVPAGAGTTASGKKLPTVTLRRSTGISHSFTIQDREGADTGVEASYRDLDAAQTKTVVAGDADGTVKKLRPVYPTEGEAAAAAAAAKSEAKRAQREIRLSCAVGMPELIAGQPLRLTGFREEIDEVPWVVEDITHTLTDGEGLHSSLTAKG